MGRHIEVFGNVVCLLSKRSKLGRFEGNHIEASRCQMMFELVTAACAKTNSRTWTSSFKDSRSPRINFFTPVVDNQLTRINGDRWHPHSSTYDRNTVTFYGTSVTKRITDFVQAGNRRLQGSFSNKFRTEEDLQEEEFIKISPA